jgi:hypothetical protein
MEQLEKLQMTIWRMRIACWIPMATNAHVSICNTYSFSTELMNAQKTLSVT